jgi:hypothetical protein
LAGGLNAYGFAGGDPVTYSDPFGLCYTCDSFNPKNDRYIIPGSAKEALGWGMAVMTAATAGVGAAAMLSPYTVWGAQVLVSAGKIGFMLGRASQDGPNAGHNVPRAAQNLAQLERIGLSEAALANHLRSIGAQFRNVSKTFTNEHGTFEVRESLLVGAKSFGKLRSTWRVNADGTREYITGRIYGGG